MGHTRGIFAILIICAALVTGCSDSTGSSSGDQKKDTSSSVGKDDLYAAGCPALNAGLGSISLVRKTAVNALDKIQDHTDLTKEHDQWLQDAKELLQHKDPNDAPDSARNRVKKACADHGHPLDNLQ